MVREALDRGGVDVNESDYEMRSCLHIAAGAGQLAVYSDKKDAAAAKPPKVTIALRTDASRVICDSLNSFKLTITAELRDGGRNGKKVVHKPGEALAFMSDDSRELTAWANDLNKVLTAYQSGAR